MIKRKKLQETIDGMTPWLKPHPWRKADANGRTRSEQAFDDGVLAASEFVRRLTDDEALAGAIHSLLTNKTKGLRN